MAHYEIIVIPAGRAITANLDANKVDTGKTSKTFTVGLSPTGKEPATHYWCSWWLSDKEAERLRQDFSEALTTKHQAKMFDRRTWEPYQVLASMGLKVIQAEIIEPEIIYNDEITHMGMYVNL